MCEKYTSEQLHKDINEGRIIGNFGGSHAAYHALAELKAKEDLGKYHTKRSKDEFILEDLETLMNNPKTQKYWDRIVSMDPRGLWSARPTISATVATMRIEELRDMEPDGVIVREDGGIACTKIAVEHVWNIPAIAEKLGFDEGELRATLAKYTQNEKLLDTSLNAYLPQIGGVTIYVFGDLTKIADKSTEIAIRVHDECNGSDVFGTDICTCRPYLIYALQGAVECAQRGGVGLVIYYRKEGRALGEVTKFRVYNARKRQEGGDRAETYFAQTESIAGIRDARVQEFMPDIILWLGIDRIDKLLSMSADKYDAITGAGIEVMQRCSLPEELVPENAQVEISAKIFSGYHSNAQATTETMANLMKVESVRTTCHKVFDLAKEGKAKYFNLNLDKLHACAELVVETTKKNYADIASIPYHSRWRHFEKLGPVVENLVATWKCNALERTRRLFDLATVSVLLDAGAGPTWKYVDEDGNTWARSEGLAMASIDMFKGGLFSSDPACPSRVNSYGIRKLTIESFKHALQHSKANPLAALEDRFEMLQRLAQALDTAPDYFGDEIARPGNMVDYLLAQATNKTLKASAIFDVVVQNFSQIWPTNSPKVRGDLWSYSPLFNGTGGSDLVCLHKISQWLTYSLIEPLEQYGLTVTNLDDLTALAEYRNGGLLVDIGVLTLKDQENALMVFDVGSQLIVEWRALTVILMDLVAEEVRKILGLNAEQLPIAKVLQGGTWFAGRVIAAQKRPDGSPPITIRLNGMTF